MSDELNLSNLKPAQPRKARKRIGRGLGSGKGQTVISSTLSSMRVATAATSAKAASSKRAVASNGSRTKRVRSSEPRQQQP